MIVEQKIINNFFEISKKNILKIFDPQNINSVKFVKSDNILELYDKNKNLLIRAYYQEIGTWDYNTKIWIWSWNKILTNNKLSVLTKQIKKNSKNILKQIITCGDINICKDLEEYYYISKNGNFSYDDDIMKIIKFAMYVNDVPWYIELSNNNDSTIPNGKIHYFFITSIINY